MASLPTTMDAIIPKLMTCETEVLVQVIFAVLAVVLAGMAFMKKEKTAMHPTEFQKFKLAKKEIISHDTRRFTFDLQTPKTKLGLPIGQHITLRFTDENGKNHQRSYTPVTSDEVLGSVTFVIKVYKAGVHPKFPEGGKMSQHLDSLQIGDSIEMRGPKGHMEYLGQGNFTLKLMRKPLQHRCAKHFGMIAGGTGITPMLQVIQAIFRDQKDKTTTMSLLYANQTEEDILVRKELEILAAEYPNRFKLHYTLDRPTEEWKGSTGFVDKTMVKSHVLSETTSKTDTQVLMCGPPPMLKFACIPALKELGYNENNWFSF